jgi:hypothetical protein
MLSRFAVAILLACSLPVLRGQAGTASLSGAVQAPDGKPFTSVLVTLESAAAGIRQASYVNEQGFYQFSGLPDGVYILNLSGVYASVNVKVKLELLAGEQRSLPPVRPGLGAAGDCGPPTDLDPERSKFPSTGPSLGGLAGNVANGLGPVIGARVVFACWIGACKGDSNFATTDSQGNFAFDNLSPGKYSVNVGQIGFLPAGGSFNVAGGLENYYPFKLKPCPNGDCTIKPDPNVKPIMCE